MTLKKPKTQIPMALLKVAATKSAEAARVVQRRVRQAATDRVQKITTDVSAFAGKLSGCTGQVAHAVTDHTLQALSAANTAVQTSRCIGNKVVDGLKRAIGIWVLGFFRVIL